MNNIETTLRRMIEHEDEQMHRRLSWLSSFQGFLFAALGLTWGKSDPLILVVTLLGLAVALLVLASSIATAMAISSIHKYWHTHKDEKHEGPGISGFYPAKAPWTLFISPEVLLPVAFSAAWIAVLFIS